MKVQFIRGYLAAIIDPTMAPMALRVAVVVGTILFAINHGNAVAQSKMTRARWLSVVLTYGVPYAVNIHGQYVMQASNSGK